MSRRSRKSDCGITNFDALLKAIKEVIVDKKSKKTTARTYNIPGTSFLRYIKKFEEKVPDITKVSDDELLKTVKEIASFSTPSLVFNEEEEEALVAYILQCCNLYYGLSITELRQLAYQFAIKIKSKYPDSWAENEMAGYARYYAFMKRHRNLALRTPEQTSLNRVKAFCKENVQQFFGYLKTVYDTTPFSPSAIYNMDETGFSTVPTKIGKIISLKGMKRVGKIVSAERGTMVTMAMSVSASGNSIPPFFLFPRKKMQSYFMDNATPDAVGLANESGWMQQNEFVKYIEHFIKYTHSSKETPTLLLLDNHASHLSVEAVDMAADHGITLLSFPPHCSHRMQPLDVSVYGPLKGYYKTQCDAWMTRNAGKVLEIRHIPMLVANALDKALLPSNIKTGFRCTGISPFDPDVFNESDFIQAAVSGKNTEAATIESEYEPEVMRCITVLPANQVIAHKEVTTSEPSTSATPSIASCSTSLSSLLSEIGPMQVQTPAKKSNCGRKPMQSTILTSPENIAILKEKRAAKEAKSSTKKTPTKIRHEKRRTSTRLNKAAKRSKMQSDASSSDEDNLCMMCGKSLPDRLTCQNSVKCVICKKPAHFACVNQRHRDFMCVNCDSGDDLSEES